MSVPAPTLIGHPSEQLATRFKQLTAHKDNFVAALIDNNALHDPETLDLLIERFPKDMLKDFDLFLMLAECMANAVSYGETNALGLHARKRSRLLLLSIFHDPALGSGIDPVLRNAHDGWLPDFDKDPPSGLGFPILFRLAYQITVSLDRSRLQLWIRLRNTDE